MSATRQEKDSIGIKDIPAEAYYGINGVRAVENFPISGLKAHPQFIDAFLLIKKAAALANKELKMISDQSGDAIVKACDEILGGKLRDQFVVDVFQMGAEFAEVIADPVPPESEDSAQEAADDCPVEAIIIE